MNKLSTEKRAQIIGMTVEGVSIRAITRLTGVSNNTVIKLLRDVRQPCSEYRDKALRDLPWQRLQLDEIWSFVYAKAKNVPEHKQGEAGDIWTWTAIDADTKLLASWMVRDRSGETARMYVDDLARRLTSRVQLSSDGNRAYIDAIEGAFGANVDYAMLEKMYAISE